MNCKTQTQWEWSGHNILSGANPLQLHVLLPCCFFADDVFSHHRKKTLWPSKYCAPKGSAVAYLWAHPVENCYIYLLECACTYMLTPIPACLCVKFGSSYRHYEDMECSASFMCRLYTQHVRKVILTVSSSCHLRIAYMVWYTQLSAAPNSLVPLLFFICTFTWC